MGGLSVFGDDGGMRVFAEALVPKGYQFVIIRYQGHKNMG